MLPLGVSKRRKKSRGRLNSVNRPNVEASEADCVAAAAAGDREARRELFERHRQAAYQAAYRITGRDEDALDVVQDGFIKAFEGLAGFQREAGFKTWLLRIVTNRALDVLRSRKVRIAAPLAADDDEGRCGAEPATDEDTDAPERRLERAELSRRVRDALEQLPPEQRAVFALFADGEMTYGQIAEIVGVPIGTVMSRLFHARRKLKELLGEWAPAGRAGPTG
jgi:RNA polymerase sigma-70 factor (ECF subfamily)